MATISQDQGSVPEPSASRKTLITSLAWGIVLNATIPVGCYFLAKRFISPSELTDLIFATLFPMLKSVHDLVRRRELDPVAVLVLLGILTSILALFFGGSPRLLLIRESFFTGAFGIACFLSLVFPRPIMFYFGRYFLAGKDPQRRKIYSDRWENPVVRRGHRLITMVWGLVFTGEFLIRTLMVYTLPIPVVLTFSPFFTGFATIFTIAWTFRYAHKIRKRISA